MLRRPEQITDYLLELDLDILFLTETWLRSGSTDNGTINDLTVPGYSFKHKPRKAKHRGGGIGILCKSSIGLKLKPPQKATTSFEFMECSFTLHGAYIHTALIYRVPPSQKNKIPKNLFLEEFSDLMESLSIIGGKLLVVGDFNIPWNKKEHSEMKEFQELLSTFNLMQHVNFVTHNGGNTLDYIISREDDHLVSSVSQGDVIADHSTVLANLQVTKPPTARKKVSVRKITDVPKSFGLSVFTDTFDPKPNSSQICSVQKTDYPADKISDIAPLNLTVPGLYQGNRQKDRVSGTHISAKGWMPEPAEKR